MNSGRSCVSCTTRSQWRTTIIWISSAQCTLQASCPAPPGAGFPASSMLRFLVRPDIWRPTKDVNVFSGRIGAGQSNSHSRIPSAISRNRHSYLPGIRRAAAAGTGQPAVSASHLFRLGDRLCLGRREIHVHDRRGDMNVLDLGDTDELEPVIKIGCCKVEPKFGLMPS